MLALVAVLAIAAVVSMPIDDYVNAPDDNYAWNVTTTIKGIDYTVHNLFLTSQAWLTVNDTTQPIWYHWLSVCIPTRPMVTDVGFLYIDGGHTPNYHSPPTKADALSAGMCGLTGIVGAHLTAIPNESFRFLADPTHKMRSEDALIAYTWSRFMNHTDQPWWLLRFPMAKAAVRAMDAMTAFVATLPQFKLTPLKRFIVAGASKRGWDTWTVGAVDQRVIAIVPMVAPVINLVPQINEMWQAYGAWSFALEDYQAMNLMAYLNNPLFELILWETIDGLYQRLTMPKMVISDCADEFFMPDAPQYFWNRLPNDKLLRIIPNAEHSMAGHQIDMAVSDISGFIMSVVRNRPRPNITWEISPDGTQITAQLLPGQDGKYPYVPKQVLMWHAYNSKRRDFRFFTCADIKNPACLQAIIWGPRVLTNQGNYTYVAQMAAPSVGWSGFLIEFEFTDTGGGNIIDPMKVTSNVSIIPKRYPFPPCGAACNQTLPKSR